MRFAIFLAAASLASGAEPAEFFEAKIRPLLVNRCYALPHGNGERRVARRFALGPAEGRKIGTSHRAR